MLLVLTKPSTSSDLYNIDLRHIKILPDSIEFDASNLAMLLCDVDM